MTGFTPRASSISAAAQRIILMIIAPVMVETGPVLHSSPSNPSAQAPGGQRRPIAVSAQFRRFLNYVCLCALQFLQKGHGLVKECQACLLAGNGTSGG